MRRPRPVEKLAVGLVTPAGEVLVGTLVWSLHRRQAFFEFTPAFLAGRLRISPLALPMKDGALPADARLFEGLHGVFDDSLLDGWGRLLVDRRLRVAGGDPTKLSPMDRLAMVGKSGMGALTYVPMEPRSGGRATSTSTVSPMMPWRFSKATRRSTSSPSSTRTEGRPGPGPRPWSSVIGRTGLCASTSAKDLASARTLGS